MRKVLWFSLLLTAAASVFATTGNLDLKVAVVCYNPFMTNVAELTTARRLNAVFGWPTGQNMATQQKNWWKEATDGMVKANFVVVTNLNIFPLMTSGKRFNQQSYYDYWKKGQSDKHPGGSFDYAHFLTNDVPWMIPAIEDGRIDQVWLYGWPGMNTNETRLFGKGAFGCNSYGFSALQNERMFMMCMPSIERSDTPMENFGHGCEWHLGGAFHNYVYSFEGGIRYTNVHDMALYRAHGSESSENICIGDVHYAPNSKSDYDWGNTTPVECYADCWYDFPNMTNWVPRTMTCADWGGGVNYKHKIWFFHHMPRKVGLHRGHMMNWITKYMNPNIAAYPIGSHEQVRQEDVDLAGFFSFEMNVPEGTTQLVVRVNTGLPVLCGLRKNYIPFFDRYQQAGSVYDYLSSGRQHEHTITLTKDDCYGKGLEGKWYLSFGSAYGYGYVVTYRPLDSNTFYTVEMELSPKPASLDGTEYVEITKPAEGDYYRNMTEPVKWEYKAPSDGWRAFYLSYSTNDFEGPWIDICEDYYYELDKDYSWNTFPYKEVSDRARVRIIAEDLHGHNITNYSGLFGISTEPIPEPCVAVFAFAALACLMIKRRL